MEDVRSWIWVEGGVEILNSDWSSPDWGTSRGKPERG